MDYHCFKCGALYHLSPGRVVGRGESCDKCTADIRCCRNCKHYDRSVFNECRETQAERVLEKERANFCDYFSFRSGAAGAGTGSSDAKKKLDDLFK